IPIDGYAPAWYVDNECGVANWRHADTIHVSGDIIGIDVCVVPISGSGFSSISGQILGGSNLLTTTPIQGVTVYAISSSTNEVVGYDITEDDGVYAIDNLPAGSYTIEVDKEGYSATSPLSITVDESNNFEMTDAVINVTSDPPVSVADISTVVPLDYRLYQNYPNPFNPTTEIRIDIPKTSSVSLKIYNIAGQEVTTLVNGVLLGGVYKFTMEGLNSRGEPLSSGIYFVKFEGISQDGDKQAFIQTRKIMLIR
ncbi:MAG TPA: carboxypeptidase regulatory-like domain-containing protein, partial [Bacteroidota bacterium]|nr:carboxypeptidase regulatory-like domain-containing protein [Bacteroidota bacterium]